VTHGIYLAPFDEGVHFATLKALNELINSGGRMDEVPSQLGRD